MKSLPIWIFWLLACMTLGGMIGAWLSSFELDISFAGIMVGGFAFTCFSLWRNW
jgi:hypothetical protein